MIGAGFVAVFMAGAAISTTWDFLLSHLEWVILFFVISCGSTIIQNQNILDRKLNLLGDKLDRLANNPRQ